MFWRVVFFLNDVYSKCSTQYCQENYISLNNFQQFCINYEIIFQSFCILWKCSVFHKTIFSYTNLANIISSSYSAILMMYENVLLAVYGWMDFNLSLWTEVLISIHCLVSTRRHFFSAFSIPFLWMADL